jgi:hypothetical protein
MHADDERDPLDRWLSQQVQPLPPPPGTFELITRRSRRRKLRKLAVTVVSAAAVAAVVAIAVPVGLNLHLSPPPTNGNLSAGGASPTQSGHTQSPYGTANPVKSPSPSPSATHSAIAPSSQAHPIPPDFQPTSVTFVSSQRAWAIGPAGTPGKCDNNDPYICTSVVRTDDAGQSWHGVHAPDTGSPSGATGVGGIRFLNDTYGWAFGPELWATDDAGNIWTQVKTGGARVTDLETSGGRAYALFATCSTPSGGPASDFAAGCTSYTLMTTTAGSGTWTPVGPATTGLANGGAATSAVLQLTGTNGYLLAPDGTLYSGSIGGTWSQAGTSLCKPGAAQANGLPSAAQLALASSTEVWIACGGTSASEPPLITTSTNGGSTWTQLAAGSWSGVGSLSDFGVTTSLAAAPSGALTLATTTGIYVLSADGDGWKPSNATGSGAPAGGFTYVGMTTDDQGVAVPADTSLHEVWMTTDGGASWAPATSITPGK